MKRVLLAFAFACLLNVGTVNNAGAFWSSTGTGGGTASTATLPGGLTPSGSVSGSTVTVSFNQVSIAGIYVGSMSGGGYEILRYSVTDGLSSTPNGTCAVPVTGSTASLTCSDTSVPPGFWRYTVEPVLGSWTSTESPQSTTVTVAPDAPATASSSYLPAADLAVSWSAVSGVDGYNVYRRTSAGSYNFAAPLNGGTLLTGTTFTDTTPVSGTTYHYVIRSVFIDGTRIESVNSPETTALTADGAAPTAVSVNNPGSPLAGTVAITANATDAISGVGSITFQYKPSAGATWTTFCTDNASPWSCAFNSTLVVDGNYDFRVIATDVAGNSTTSAAVTNRAVDNTAPSGVTITAPPLYIVGTITISGNAVDTGSGVQSVAIQRSPAGTGTWTTICSDTTSPYSCSFNSTLVTDGLYDFRAMATDTLGNTSYSTTATDRYVDNTAPTTTLGAIPSAIRATLNMTATATDATSGVASVQFQRALASGGAWTTICTDTTAPYTCAFNTTTVADNNYSFRTLATDNAGNTGTSVVQTPIRLDNTIPTATDIQTVNSGIAGRPTTGDQMIYTFSEAMQPGSILAGWSGAATTVTVRFNNGGGNDQVFVYNAANTAATGLGRVRTGNGGYVTANRLFTNSTMTMSGNTVVVTLGTPNGATNTVAANATLRWTPLATMLDLAGNAMSTANRNETGAADPNF